MLNFWEGKERCWVRLVCSKYVYPECPAYVHREVPCWEHVFTQAERLVGIKKECKYCRVFGIYNKWTFSPEVTLQRNKTPVK